MPFKACGLTETFHQFYFYSMLGFNDLAAPAQVQADLLRKRMWYISEKDCSIFKKDPALNADL